MKKLYRYCMLALLVTACSNDSNNSNDIENIQDPCALLPAPDNSEDCVCDGTSWQCGHPCDDDDDCLDAADFCNKDGLCVRGPRKGEKGGYCLADNTCHDDLYCNEGVCQEPGLLGTPCRADGTCLDSRLRCENGFCVSKAAPGEQGGPCLSDEKCAFGLVCKKDNCEFADSGKLGNACLSTHTCLDDLVCKNDKCEMPDDGKKGGKCLDGNRCDDGLVCTKGTCDFPNDGEFGGKCISGNICNGNLICQNDICTNRNDGEYGGACLSDSACNEGLFCQKGICVRIASGERGGACLPDDKCNGDFLDCQEGVCLPKACPDDAYRSDAELTFECVCQTYANRDGECCLGIESYDELVAVADKGNPIILLKDISVPTDRTFIPKLTSSLYGVRYGESSPKTITASYTEDISTGGALFGEIEGATVRDIALDLSIGLKGEYQSNANRSFSFGGFAAKTKDAELRDLSGKIVFTGELNNKTSINNDLNIGGLVGSAINTQIQSIALDMNFNISKLSYTNTLHINAGGLVGATYPNTSTQYELKDIHLKGSTTLTLADNERIDELNMGSVVGNTKSIMSHVYSTTDVRFNAKKLSYSVSYPSVFLGGLAGYAQNGGSYLAYQGSIVSTQSDSRKGVQNIGGAFGKAEGNVSYSYLKPSIRITDGYVSGDLHIAGITASVNPQTTSTTYHDNYAKPAFNYYAYQNSTHPLDTSNKTFTYAGIVAHNSSNNPLTVKNSTADLGFQFRNSDALQSSETIKTVRICGIGNTNTMTTDHVVATAHDTRFNPNIAQAIKTAWSDIMRNNSANMAGCPIGGITIRDSYYNASIWPQTEFSTNIPNADDQGVKVTVSTTGTDPDISNLFGDKTSLSAQIPYPSFADEGMAELEKLKQ